MISWTFRCCALALLALRAPTWEEHETLLSLLVSGEDEEGGLAAVFGPGYLLPSAEAPKPLNQLPLHEA